MTVAKSVRSDERRDELVYSTRRGGLRLKRIAVAVVIAAIMVAGSLVAAQPASAETRRHLGGLNFNIYCNAKYSQPWASRYGKAALLGNNVTSWRCVVSEWVGQVSGIWIGWLPGGSYSIDVNAACRTQYGRGDARAAYYNYNDPYSWYCYYPVSYYA